jgi:hypothetical protein
MPTTDPKPTWTPPPRQYEPDGTWSAPDEFFTAEQIRRMRELMAELRAASAAGRKMPDDLRAELDELIGAELKASMDRMIALHGAKQP